MPVLLTLTLLVISATLALGQGLATKRSLTLEAAKQIAAAAEAEAKRNNWNVVIAIVDDGGHLVYLQRMDETQIGSIDVAIAKAQSAVKFKRPTKAFEDALLSRQAILKLPGALPIEGGLPLMVEGKILGAIGVSGVQSNQDGIIAQAGANALAKLAAR
ncbi:MAG: heme-binding protein [Bryobacteraceae bacterium]|nr:heme-binding protein [Bryobacteraceae bacterium]MDW8380186.1 heme-binding protein [Bryobacterales bacterium]